jgi:hypothetical protein
MQAVPAAPARSRIHRDCRRRKHPFSACGFRSRIIRTSEEPAVNQESKNMAIPFRSDAAGLFKRGSGTCRLLFCRCPLGLGVRTRGPCIGDLRRRTASANRFAALHRSR